MYREERCAATEALSRYEAQIEKSDNALADWDFKVSEYLIELEGLAETCIALEKQFKEGDSELATALIESIKGDMLTLVADIKFYDDMDVNYDFSDNRIEAVREAVKGVDYE